MSDEGREKMTDDAGGGLGRRYNWKPVTRLSEAESAVERLTTVPAEPAPRRSQILAGRSQITAGPTADELHAQADQLEADIRQLRYWAAGAVLLCLLVGVSFLVP